MAKKKKKNTRHLKGLLLFIILILVIILLVKKPFNNNEVSDTGKTDSQAATASTTDSENKVEEKNQPSVIENLSEDEIKLSKERGLPVLMYHFFYDSTNGEVGKDNNFMEIHDFEEQIKYLSENNYYIPSWKEVLGYVEGKNGLPLKSVVITVDDGDESFFRLAVPVLEKYNITATSFLITSWYLDPVEREKYPSVIDFQSHSDSMHKAGSNGKGAFLTLDEASACADLEKSRSKIGEDCIVFCYPFGHFNDNCKRILKKCDYILAFTTQGGRVFPGDDPYELPRVRMSKGDSLNAFISKVK